MPDITRCFYYEDGGRCAGNNERECKKPCGYYVERRSLSFGVTACIIIGAILYMAGFITYGIGKYCGSRQVSRATCMQYMTEATSDGNYKDYRWNKR